MKIIRLYGALGERFGRVWRFDVKSPAEAVRALCSQLPGFRQHLAKYSAPGYHVVVGKESRGEDDFALPTSAKTIKIIPVIVGAGAGLRIIAGIAMMVIGSVMSAYQIPGGEMVFNMGVSMVFGGVIQLLTKPPNMANNNTPDRPENRPSYAFDGAANTAAQGNAVSVCYGRLIVGSQVVSAGLFAEQVAN